MNRRGLLTCLGLAPVAAVAAATSGLTKALSSFGSMSTAPALNGLSAYTSIDGGRITATSITATKITAGSITCGSVTPSPISPVRKLRTMGGLDFSLEDGLISWTRGSVVYETDSDCGPQMWASEVPAGSASVGPRSLVVFSPHLGGSIKITDSYLDPGGPILVVVDPEGKKFVNIYDKDWKTTAEQITSRPGQAVEGA